MFLFTFQLCQSLLHFIMINISIVVQAFSTMSRQIQFGLLRINFALRYPIVRVVDVVLEKTWLVVAAKHKIY